MVHSSIAVCTPVLTLQLIRMALVLTDTAAWSGAHATQVNQENIFTFSFLPEYQQILDQTENQPAFRLDTNVNL